MILSSFGFLRRLSAYVALLAFLSGSCMAQPSDSKGSVFFEGRVVPILCGHCTLCHNEQLQASDLSFLTRKDLLVGGDRGPAIVPYHPEQSILIHAIRRDGGLMKFPVMMPPGPKLTDEDIATLTEWVQRGAPWGGGKLACAVGSPPTPFPQKAGSSGAR
ncbi:MAG TPA: c-type cytochrome domain-containing protein [Acidobacteriaceae bacterium]|nr:c-type cytochrome domain-containing protein [Acidobacteriaceae bacterium]